MAIQWTAKAPAEVVTRTWSPDLNGDDDIASVSATATDLTVSAESEDRAVIVTVSGGEAGTTYSVEITATTIEGLTLVETFQIAVVSQAEAFAQTPADLIRFAYLKIRGDGEDPTAEQSEVGLEMLNMMVAQWRIEGLDIGLSGLLAADTALAIRDEYILGLKYNLKLMVLDHYNSPATPLDAALAEQSKRMALNTLTAFGNLEYPHTFTRSPETVASLFP